MARSTPKVKNPKNPKLKQKHVRTGRIEQESSESESESEERMSEAQDDLDEQESDLQSSESGQESEDEQRNHPQYSQYIDEEDLELDDDEDEEDEEEQQDEEDDSRSDSGSEDQDAAEAGPKEEDIRRQLASLPFSALLKARKTLSNGQNRSGEDSEEEEEEEEEEEDLEPDEEEDSEQDEFETERRPETVAERRSKIKAELEERKRLLKNGVVPNERPSAREEREREKLERKQKAEMSRKLQEEREERGRRNKHAPTEQSSKKPVSRKRTVIEQRASKLRDPRFSSLSSGPTIPSHFSQTYSFLDPQREAELSTLKTTLKTLQKQEANHAGPKAKSEYAESIREEKARVERALKRAEGKKNERERREREKQVMKRVRDENYEKLRKGGKAWYLKESDKKALLLKDKFERLANGTSKDNGTGSNDGDGSDQKRNSKALRKALDRRRKKNEAKEKKFGGIKIGGGALSLGCSGSEGAPKRFRDPGWAGNGAGGGGGEASWKKKREREVDGEKKVRKRGKRG